MEKKARMQELIRLLSEASRAYYQESREIMTNEHYDKLYDELQALEAETGMVLSGSPTVQVGYEVVSELPREAHETPALSLDKTKEVDTLATFLSDRKGVLSWKLDGLTIVLTYDGGMLEKAVTRGNGEVGEVVTGNARTFKNLPMQIPFQGHLVLRGEAVIRYSDFERMNAEIEEDAKYKNPRNLCAGSVRQLDPSVTASRSVNLVAFALISAEGVDVGNSMMRSLNFLDEQGFETVERMMVTGDTVSEGVQEYARRIQHYDIPSDGLVLLLDDIAYGQSLGRTAKFPRNAIAFKWRDEMADTTLLQVEWSASRTGLINPVAIFEPVELEGTTVSRASVHNVSITKELGLGIGDTIRVYKANMIIPQIAENLTRSGNLKIPTECPVCGGPAKIHEENDVQTLYCENEDCAIKQIKAYDLLASRNALKIDGLSEAILEKLIDAGILHSFADLFRLEAHKETFIHLEGFGEKSYEKLTASVEKARETTLSRFLYGLGIPGIGVAGGKLLAKAYQSLERLQEAEIMDLAAVPQIGLVTATDIYEYFRNPKKQAFLSDLLSEIHILPEDAEESGELPLAGKTFVITGAVHIYKNRDELKEVIEKNGGKTASSVSKNTDYLINNDVLSQSSKNKKARELEIPILSEEAFQELLTDRS